MTRTQLTNLWTKERAPRTVLVLGLALLCGWAYWPTLCIIAEKWVSDPQYSHGYFVPVFAAVLLWLRFPHLAGVTFQPRWGGVFLLALAAVIRLAGAFVAFDWLDAVSLLPCLAGLCVLLGGWPVLRWCWPSVAFLVFMIPLPFLVEHGMSHSLQRVATLASTYTLQTLGLPAFAEGNVIIINDSTLGVAEACSGLSMLLVFFALATAVAIVVKRPLLDRLFLVASAVPIALVANITRITVTGVMYETVGGEAAQFFFHDLAGWLMMPFALVILWSEVWLLSRLLLEPPPAGPVPVAFGAPPGEQSGRKAERGPGKMTFSGKGV